jgi:hypothetical protein
MHLTLYSARLCTLTAILAPLVGIHRRFIAHCPRRGCPTVVPVRCKAISVLRPPGSSCGPPSSLQAGGGENHCYTHPPCMRSGGPIGCNAKRQLFVTGRFGQPVRLADQRHFVGVLRAFPSPPGPWLKFPSTGDPPPAITRRPVRTKLRIWIQPRSPLVSRLKAWRLMSKPSRTSIWNILRWACPRAYPNGLTDLP